MLTLVGLKVNRVLAKNTYVKGNLADAMANDSTDTDIIFEQYRKNISAIDAYASAIRNMEINIYGTEPVWYTKEFKERFVLCKSDAQVWINDVMDRLVAVPKCIVNYDVLYKSRSSDILSYCKLLIKDPSAGCQEQLIDCIQQLENSVIDKCNLIQQIEEDIAKYITTISNDKDFLDETKKSASATEDADKQQLEKWTNNKNELEAEIAHLQDVIMGTGITGGVLLTAAPIGFVCGPVGIFIGIFVTAAALASLLTAISESVICNQKRSELEGCINSMNEITKTIASLNDFCGQLEKILNEAEAAKIAAQNIKQLWETLGGEMEELISKIKNEESDAQNEIYLKLVTEIENSDKEWQAIVDLANIYAQLNIETRDTVIDVDEVA